MMMKLFICLGICLAVLLGSLAGTYEGMKFLDSKKLKEEIMGAVITAASIILLFASLLGMIVFTIKAFGFYLYGTI